MAVKIADNYADLMAQLTSRVATKSASTITKAATGDSAPGITDPRDKGKIAIPKDPDATNMALKLPATGMNDSVTPVTTLAPAKTVDGPEKTATIQKKAQKVAADMAALRKTLSKSATAAEITPNMPTDCVNKDSNPASTMDNGPKNKGVPDPEANKDAAPKGDKGMAGPPDPAAKPVSMPTPDSKGEIPADKMNENDKSANLVDFDPMFHFKLASLILSTEEGKAYAQQIIEQHHGALEADSIIKAASYMEQTAQDLQRLESEGENAAAQLWDAATPEEKESILKLAHLHASAKSTLATDMEKQAYDDGAAAAAAQQDPMAGAGGPPGADPTGGAGGAAPGAGADPAGGGEISDEDIMQVLEQLVQSGEIKPEEAQAILQALQQGGAPGGDAAGGPPGGADPMAGAGGPPMAEPPADAPPEDKMAFVTIKSASAAVDAILAGMAK